VQVSGNRSEPLGTREDSASAGAYAKPAPPWEASAGFVDRQAVQSEGPDEVG
jgi:hypothetical protein